MKEIWTWVQIIVRFYNNIRIFKINALLREGIELIKMKNNLFCD